MPLPRNDFCLVAPSALSLIILRPPQPYSLILSSLKILATVSSLCRPTAHQLPSKTSPTTRHLKIPIFPPSSLLQPHHVCLFILTALLSTKVADVTSNTERASRTAASNGASVLLAAAASAETSSAYALGPASWNSAGNAQPGPSQYPSQYVTNTPRTPATRTGVSLPRVNMACRSCRCMS